MVDRYQPPQSNLGAPSAPEPFIVLPRGPKRWPWVMLLVVSIAMPFAEATVFRGRPYEPFMVIEALLLLATIYWWYVLDRRERKFETGGLQNVGVLLLTAIGLPIYLFRSRGWLRGLVATAVAVVAWIALNFVEYFSGELGVLVWNVK